MNKTDKKFFVIGLIGVCVMVFAVGCWVTNLYKLGQCDFEAPYRCEFIHGVGLVGPLAIPTVWFDDDSKEVE